MKSNNAYLQGNFAPVSEEQNTACNEIIGEIPTDLDGCFLRTGPNNEFDPLDDDKYHWFDGDGMVHNMEFFQGEATYRNKWIETVGLKLEREEGKALWNGFKTLPDFNNKHGIPAKNVANTAMVWHANRLLALWEQGLPYELSLPDLKTSGEENYKGEWQHPTSAHPKVCPKTGELITFCYSPIGKYQVQYGVIDKTGKVTHKTGVKLKGKPVMIHDLAITTNYTIFMDMPITFDLERAMSGGEPFLWEPENGCRMGIIPRYGNGDEVVWFDIELGYIFHVLNSWEEGDEVILEGCRANQVNISLDDTDPNTANDDNGRPHQYRFNLKTGEVKEKRITETAMEFTRINENYVGVKNRFAYGSRFCKSTDKPVFDAVVKLDRETDTEEVLEFDEGCFTGEFVFAPKVGSKSEDDGYHVGFVFNEKEQRSECWVIDAKNYLQGPIARVIMPSRVPYGFHALWVPGDDIRKQSLKLV